VNDETTRGTLLVVGAAGDVGQGIVAAALSSGRRVIAAGRNGDRLERLAARCPGEPLFWVVGDIATEGGAAALWEAAAAKAGGIDAVVISVNAPNRLKSLMDWSAADLSAVLSGNLLVHFIAAKVFVPRLPESGILIGIGGGTADFIIPKMAYVSVSQAAQRMMYRGFARERQTGAQIRELMIVSMVNGESSRETAKPDWVTDVDVGRHVCAILDAPTTFPGPVLQLKSREQVGRPEAPA
jgi:NAD(P)-dependent dehydrogenase (short-subunit alcohol dehydrogenase family)